MTDTNEELKQPKIKLNNINSAISSKPLIPPKPKITQLSTTHTTTITTATNTQTTDVGLTNEQLKSYSTLIESLKEKMSIRNSNQNLDDLVIDANDLSFNLLDEIYAEIEDKQLKSSIKLDNNKKQHQQPPKYCASLSCSSSSYTSASSNQSNTSCTCMSDSTESPPPPLPSMPPPPLMTTSTASPPQSTKSRSSSQQRDSTHLLNEFNSLSLEQEIELEMKNKFSLLFKSSEDTLTTLTNDSDHQTSNKLDSDLNFDLDCDYKLDSEINHNATNHEIIVETDYLEPINLIKSNTNEMTNSIIVQELSQSNKSHSKTSVLSPSYRIKSYIQAKLNSNNQETNKKSLNYLIKQSNKISSTLRFMRTKSTNDDANILESTLNSIKRQANSQKRRSTSSNSTKTNSSVQISAPTLISQTFDLRNQNLIEIVKLDALASTCSSNCDDESFCTTSSFSSASSSISSSSKLEAVYHTTEHSSNSSYVSHSNMLQTNLYEEQFDFSDAGSTQYAPGLSSSSSTTNSRPTNNNLTKSNSNSSLNNSNTSSKSAVGDASFQDKRNALGKLFQPATQPPTPSPPPVIPQPSIQVNPAPPPPPQTALKPNSSASNLQTGSTNGTSDYAASNVTKKPAPPTPPPRNDLDSTNNKPSLNNIIKPSNGQPNVPPKPTVTQQTSNNSLNYKASPPPPPPPPPPPSISSGPAPPPPPPPPKSPQFRHNPPQFHQQAPPPPPPPNQSRLAPPNMPPPPPPTNPPPPIVHRPVPPIPTNGQQAQPMQKPRTAPQPPSSKPAISNIINTSVDELERRFKFLPFPNSNDIPKTFAPPSNREYPSARYEKLKANRA